MAISYAGLPGKRCSTCGGSLFSRFSNVLRCGQCQPPAAGEKPDEWLESSYQGGVLRWAAAIPPSEPTVATLWLYVAENLDAIEVSPSNEIAEVWHTDGRWFRKLDRRLLAWLYSRVLLLERHSFPEDVREALATLCAIVARGVEAGVFGSEFADQSRWPKSPGGFDPFGGLFDPSRINFPGLRLPAASDPSTTAGKRSSR